jgi:hypothetical protein
VEFEGDGAVRALSVTLDYDAAVVEPVGMEDGALLAGAPHVTLSSRPGNVDVGLLGAGLAGRGRLATLRFRVRAEGEARIGLGAVEARDGTNRAVTLGRTASVRAAPERTMLSAGMPTPFRQGTQFEYALVRSGRATLAIYSVDGRRIRTLQSGAREAGVYRVAWDGQDDDGRAVVAGLYFARLTTADASITRTVMRVP